MTFERDGEAVICIGDSGKRYRIDLNVPSCECADFTMRHAKAGTDCKHLAMARARAVQASLDQGRPMQALVIDKDASTMASKETGEYLNNKGTSPIRYQSEPRIQTWRDRWSMEQVKLMQNTICPDHTVYEIAFFLEYCLRRGLDPLAKQIYSIKRKGKQTFQTSIDYLRSNAEESGLYDGQDDAEWCGKSGEWKDIWLADEPPAAARVKVYRKGTQRPIAGIALWSEYCPEPGSDWRWKKAPSGQLAKCAEAIALRKAFPERLGGLYSHDEMDQAEGRAVAQFVGKHKLKALKQEARELPEPTVRPEIAEIKAGDPDSDFVEIPAKKWREIKKGKAPAIMDEVQPLARRFTPEEIQMEADFARMQLKLPKDRYYAILGAHGVEHAHEFTDLRIAREAYAEMLAEVTNDD